MYVLYVCTYIQALVSIVSEKHAFSHLPHTFLSTRRHFSSFVSRIEGTYFLSPYRPTHLHETPLLMEPRVSSAEFENSSTRSETIKKYVRV